LFFHKFWKLAKGTIVQLVYGVQCFIVFSADTPYFKGTDGFCLDPRLILALIEKKSWRMYSAKQRDPKSWRQFARVATKIRSLNSLRYFERPVLPGGDDTEPSRAGPILSFLVDVSRFLWMAASGTDAQNMAENRGVTRSTGGKSLRAINPVIGGFRGN
jgi:hypothetical protein